MNVEDLKEKIYKLINHPELAYELGKQGHRLSEYYDWNNIAIKTMKVYNE